MPCEGTELDIESPAVVVGSDNISGAFAFLETTPAMEAGVTDFLWSMEDIVMMSSLKSWQNFFVTQKFQTEPSPAGAEVRAFSCFW